MPGTRLTRRIVASSGRWGVHQRSACVDMTAIPFFLLRLSAELIVGPRLRMSTSSVGPSNQNNGAIFAVRESHELKAGRALTDFLPKPDTWLTSREVRSRFPLMSFPGTSRPYRALHRFAKPTVYDPSPTSMICHSITSCRRSTIFAASTTSWSLLATLDRRIDLLNRVPAGLTH
jgi:hypothetical protein